MITINNKELFPVTPPDPSPVSYCDRCGGEIFPQELVHIIDGFIICPDCFFDFCFDYFESGLVLGSELKKKNV